MRARGEFATTAALAAITAACGVGALLVGSVPLSAAEVVGTLLGGGSALERDIVMELRLPRVLGALCCGALLAMAGTLLQALLRNPLADPYVLGVSGGAGVGALAAMAAGLAAWTAAAALAGAAAALTLLAVVSVVGGGGVQRVLLTGVVIATGCGALASLLLALAPEVALRGMLHWLLGDLEHARAGAPALFALAGLVALCVALGRPLDALALGPAKAASLGLGVGALQCAVIGLAAVATVGAVLLGGAIGFVGLVVPHLVRRLGAMRHAALLPRAALAGGALVMLADAVARSVAAPQALPTGVVTALIGVPFTLWLLARR